MACKSYRAGGACADGFLTVPACWNSGGCPTCGAPSKTIPNCLRDDLPAHWLTDEGLPRFYKAAPGAGGK